VATPFIAVVADDLTGSGDTAVQFVRAGWKTQLSVGRAAQALADPGAASAEVLAVTTHSRALPAAQAAQVVGEDLAALRAAGVRRLYKKVDSTLRGAFKAEIDAARQAWRDDAIAVVCPAFPATGRTVKDGILYVDGVPVSQTSAATDPVTPVTESHIPTLLAAAHLALIPGESHHALAARIEQVGNVVAVDAVTPDDMERLAQAIGLIGERALPVGSGGLATPLARVWAAADSQGPVLVVITSQHSASRRQAAALADAGAKVWSPTLQQLADEQAWQDWRTTVCDEAVAASVQTPWVLLAPEGRHPEVDADTVAAHLGALAGWMIQAFSAAGVVATGGDGASAVLDALQAGGIALADEVTGGVPVGTLTGGPAAGLPIVTKAGGFGADDVLIRAARAVRERRFT